ncbi:pseudouridine synthase [Cognatazoarcus halotolerans]|uniref:pseudouridine synthase n=1 Tax=Cognatazoarcus halotolerans TaxID=2686016 RepID=UPI00135BB9B9|nr:pseudouridine synthase [Cognatazoarcus halotolerans]MCB1901406.1 pseudouridine synthase [Rhodocyclaceae bacterium]MCP5311232.1 pseudouridine synthase [Zoogloeaceae bacterium]
MSRNTLKLPKKSAQEAPGSDGRKPARRPIRGGSQVRKPPPPRPERPDDAEHTRGRRPAGSGPARDEGRVERTGRRDERPARPRVQEKSPRPARSDRNARTEERSSPRAAERPHSDAGRSEPDLPRLSKVLSERGICSRREADDWIENGWVRVDGEVIDTLGSRVRSDAFIEIHDDAMRSQAELVTILVNKPIGYVSGQAEDGYEPASVLVQPENRWSEDNTPINFKPAHVRRLAPAGRLDIDSTGLLVLTQDGRVARWLIGEDSTVEKEYLVRVEGELSSESLKLLNHGLSLDGVKLKPAKVSWQNEDQLRFVLREGRKRQIRRMCELVGLKVVGLKRVRIGRVSLGQLPVGHWRYLRRDEKF